MGVEASACAR